MTKILKNEEKIIEIRSQRIVFIFNHTMDVVYQERSVFFIILLGVNFFQLLKLIFRIFFFRIVFNFAFLTSIFTLLNKISSNCFFIFQPSGFFSFSLYKEREFKHNTLNNIIY